MIEVFSFATELHYMVSEVAGLPWLTSACNRHLLSTFALQTNGLAGRNILSSSALPQDCQAKHRRSKLLYCIGEDANDTVTSMHVTADERKQYQAVIVKLDGFFPSPTDCDL